MLVTFEGMPVVFVAVGPVGVNWWLEFIGDWRGNTEELRQIINKGPPKL